MLTLLFRKMRSTRWMVLCLFIGFLLAAGMMSTVPIYMDSSLQRILIKDMQAYQTETGLYPGEYVVTSSISVKDSNEQRRSAVNSMRELVDQQTARIHIPQANSKTVLTDGFMYLITGKTARVKVIGMTGLADHAEIIQGRMFEPGQLPDGSFEIVCNEECLKTLGMSFGGTYQLQNSFFSAAEPLTVTVVGVFRQASENDSYWSETMEDYLNALFMDYDTMLGDYLSTGLTTLSGAECRYSFDYQKMDLNDLSSVTKAIEEDRTVYSDAGMSFSMGISDILSEYAVRAANLKSMLWILQIPTIVMLAFYLFMVSQLNVEQEKNEIAVFKSRGASSAQIFAI